MIDHVLALLEGLPNTLAVIAGGWALALLLSLVAGLAADSPRKPIRLLGRTYVETFRGTSALIQLYWFAFVLPLLLGISLPLMLVGMVVLGLNIGAYGAEVVRGAMLSVPKGQREAAIALHMTRGQMLQHVLLPQAVPMMIPPATNLFVELAKASSLVMFITIHDVMLEASILKDRAPQDSFQIYAAVMIIYGIVSSVGIFAISRLEFRSVRRWVGRLLALPIRLVSASMRLVDHPMIWKGSAFIIVILLLMLTFRLIDRWENEHAANFLPYLWEGLQITLMATAGGSLLALILGLVWASLRRLPWVNRPLGLLLDSIRSTPLLAQLFLIYFGVLPFFGLSTDPLIVGILALGIHYSTYTAEVYRSGIDAIGIGQREACRSLGIDTWHSFRHVILPQAIPRVVPALGNYVVALFKETPLLMAITVSEMLSMADEYLMDHFRGIEAYTLVGLTFLLLSLGTAALIRLTERLLPVRHA